QRAAGASRRAPASCPAEDSLPPLVLRAPASEDVELDPLEIKQLDHGIKSLAHPARLLAFVPRAGPPAAPYRYSGQAREPKRPRRPLILGPSISARNLDGVLLFLPPGVLASDQDKNSRSLARVI